MRKMRKLKIKTHNLTFRNISKFQNKRGVRKLEWGRKLKIKTHQADISKETFHLQKRLAYLEKCPGTWGLICSSSL